MWQKLSEGQCAPPFRVLFFENLKGPDMQTLIAALTLTAGPLAAHPFHAEISAPILGGAFVLLASILLIAKRAGLGQ